MENGRMMLLHSIIIYVFFIETKTEAYFSLR